MENTNVWARGGVMIRETPSGGSTNAFMFWSAGKMLAFQRRLTTGGTTFATLGASNTPAPRWLRLDRAGNTFTAYQSVDGVNWIFVGSDTMAGTLDKAPFWVKLERIGNTFNAYQSADGATWTLVGTDTIAMGTAVYVGLAVVSHNVLTTSAGAFDFVSGSW